MLIRKLKIIFKKLMMSERFCLVEYVAVASALVILIVFLQYHRYRIFGTTLLLGWDSPAYVAMAKYVTTKGPFYMMSAWSYSHLYTQILALLGYLSGDVVMVERVLPLILCIFLIYTNSELVFRITKNVHIAGLAAFLSAFSLNILRLFSDLNRNLMAVLLSFVVFLLVSNLDDERGILNRKYLSLIAILAVIASTHFETYFVLVLTLLFYGFLSRNLKRLIALIFACAIPTVALVLLFPAYFFGYMGTVVFFERELTIGEILLWTGGSWILPSFLIIGSYFFYKSKLRNDKLILLIFSWTAIIISIVALIGLKIIPFSSEFAFRALLLLPLSVLLALATSGCNSFLKRWQLKGSSLSVKKKRAIRQLLMFFIVLCLMIASVSTLFQYIDGFLTPFVPRSSYEKILVSKEFLVNNSLSKPIFIFRGYPGVWYVFLYRDYIGAELGEHFAYYGDIENLLRLVPSEPKINFDVYLSQLERYYMTLFFDELTGSFSGPPPPLYVHDSHITSVEELMAHPIVLIAPEFYNQEIPYCLKPFHVGDGIYVIPPGSKIDFTKVSYGPEVTVTRDSATSEINSTYLYIDPDDPSIVYLSVNASHGYTSYNLTDIPSNFIFTRIEQGGDLSYPENNPMRVNCTKALSGNDPADSIENWSSPWPEQYGNLKLDKSSKKEGVASLQITGKTDSWGNLGVRYDLNGTWNLTGYSTIAVWAKSNQSAPFSIGLTDANGNSRIFWSIKAEDGSATTSWKRFSVNISDYTSQTDSFNLNIVDRIDFYVWDSNAGKPISFWIDDLTVDTFLDSENFVYKDRVPVDETVVAYFYTRIEDE